MGLIGNAFEDWVTTQINKRQSALGEGLTGTRSLDSIQAFNSSAPWIRLTSGVSIEQPTGVEAENPGVSVYDQIKNSGILQAGIWEGNLLSRNFILAGGATDESGNFISGINKGQLKSAYGWGYTTDNLKEGQGYVPMPGIVSCDFEYKNDGALAYAKVQVKAFSKQQFQIIDILFQRPGYTCLLEFGHSTFLDNSGDIQYAGKGNYSFNTSPFQKILSPPSKNNNYFEMAKAIRSEKKKWHGNYEGFFGKIAKFNWKFNSDGSYDITVNLVGTGDVISSLRVNAPKITLQPFSFNSGTIEKPSEKDQEEAKEAGSTVIADSLASQLNFELFCMFMNPNFASDTTTTMYLPDFPLGTSKKMISIEDAVYKTNVTGWFKDYDPNTWVKFGALLAVLQKTVNIKDNNGNYLLSFNFNFEDLSKDTNFMATYPGCFSSNPNKVLIPYKNFPSEVSPNIRLWEYTTINSQLGGPNTNINNKELEGVNPQLYRRLADVYLNVNYVADTLQSLRTGDPEKDDDIEVPLLDFLKALLDGINTCLGGINNFRVLFDEDTNLVSIISETPVISKKTPTTALINTFGLVSGQGSFVRSTDLSAELTDNMATQITIGSQSGGNKNGTDGTSFSIYSKGLKDRLMVKKKVAVEEDTTTAEQDKEQEKDFFEEMFDENTAEAFREIYEDADFASDYVSAMENIVSNIATKIMGHFVEKKKSQATFFLPFNLSLTMHGLAGMRIYEAFQVTGRELPLSYNPKLLSLIIKSYSHSVSVDGWTTKISTIAKPLFDVDASELKSNASRPASPPPPPSGGGGGGGSEGEGGSTIPSGYPVGKIYYEGPTNKIQIYIHHTAGWQNIKQVVAGWNTRTDHVSTVFVTNNAGEAERLYPDEAWGNHLGLSSAAFASVGASYQNLNKVSHGIEMCSIGGLKLRNGKYYCYPNNYNTEYKNNNVQRIVDKNGKDSSYKGFDYCEGFTDVHIRNVYNIVTAWKSKYGIPYTYNFDDLFPPTGKLSANALKGVKGIYTHNSVRSDKLDVMPTKKILDMFKSLAD